MLSLLDLVRISRPGWWLVSVWLYVAPTGGQEQVFHSALFWIGLAYVVLPINLLVYGVNDLTDVQIDKNNDRKGNMFFGAKFSAVQLQRLPLLIFALTALPLFGVILPIKAKLEQLTSSPPSWLEMMPSFMLWYALAVGVNIVYNVEPLRLSSKGPYEIPTAIFGQGLITVFSCMLNNMPLPPLRYWIHLSFLISRTQLWTEFMDYDVDAACKRQTTVCLFKAKYPLIRVDDPLKSSHVFNSAASIVFFSMLAEVVAVCSFFSDFGLRLFSCVGALLFVLVESSGALESLQSQKFVMAMQSLGGIGLVFHIWSNKLFVDI